MEIFAKSGDFVADSDKPFFNILLTGMVGSGKSALVNSISSTFRRRIVWKAAADDSACSHLKKQVIVKISLRYNPY